MKNYRETSNTKNIRFENNESFQKYCLNNNFYYLANLTYSKYCTLSDSYINNNTHIEQQGEYFYIYNLACYNRYSNVFIIHKKLRVKYRKNGGYYTQLRFGTAWLNSFFKNPKKGDNTDSIIPINEVLEYRRKELGQ